MSSTANRTPPGTPQSSTPTRMTPTPAAASTAEREDTIDALRGFALLGIAVVNLGAMANPFYGTGLADPAFDAPLDRAVHWLVRCVFETKFYLLFSFLFGYSFALQQDSARRAGQAFAPRWARRCLGLALLGLAHAVLLFPGDILLPYALLGLALAGLARLPLPRLRTVALCLVLGSALVWTVLGLLSPAAPLDDPADTLAQAQRSVLALRATLPTLWAHNATQLVQVLWPLIALVQAPSALAMMLLGTWAARQGVLRGSAPGQGISSPRMLLLAGVGLGGAALYATLNQAPAALHTTLLALGLGLASAPALTALYGAGLLALLRSPWGAAVQAWLAPAGRMALSLYLMQSVCGALLFTAWGWGGAGQWAPAQVLALALGLYALQLVLARAWMAGHHYGPVEWWLRALTYARWGGALRR